MGNYNVILIVKQQISALSSEKIDKNEYFTGEEILPSDERRVINQVNFRNSPVSNILEKQGTELKNMRVLKPNTQKLTITDLISENT